MLSTKKLPEIINVWGDLKAMTEHKGTTEPEAVADPAVGVDALVRSAAEVFTEVADLNWLAETLLSIALHHEGGSYRSGLVCNGSKINEGLGARYPIRITVDIERI